MGQPSGTFDETIAVWEVQEMAKKFPQAIWVRDLYPSALTDRCKLANKIAQFISVWVADGMTPVCQLTDTEIAFLVLALLHTHPFGLVVGQMNSLKRS